jgi:hypothetical protein
MNSKASFEWSCQPQAEQFILDQVAEALQNNLVIAKLAHDLSHQTSTRLFDWLDHIVVPHTDAVVQHLQKIGFERQEEGLSVVFTHPGAQLPRIVCQAIGPFGLAVLVDSIADFILTHQGSLEPTKGSIFGNYRVCPYSIENESALWLVERRGTLTLQLTDETPGRLNQYYLALEAWLTRPRDNNDQEQGMQQTIQLVQQLIEQVGQQRAAWTVLEGERRYWEARNTAGQIQKNRQDRLGMGWANHDHHTFRSSRAHFHQLVHLFELLGFHCRERFYAGLEAGWGAQVMENPTCHLVLFLDVDLAEGEIAQDFAHELLPAIEHLGTIGLWCALHGDSILKSGMHHLEAQFLFDDLTQDLANQGIQMMNPFSSFPYLKQAFTVGEKWPVDPYRVYSLVKEKKISEEKGQQFLKQGALGSHLENLQRREGYKGFNQKNVSTIIKKTDPRLTES